MAALLVIYRFLETEYFLQIMLRETVKLEVAGSRRCIASTVYCCNWLVVRKKEEGGR